MNGDKNGRPVVLVAEDDALVLRTLVGTLDQNGYTALSAGSGGEIVSAARERMPDLILMDVMLPLLDGYAAARLLRRDPLTQKIPIIAFQAPPVRRGGVREGKTLRPCDERRLLGQIRETLETRPVAGSART